MQEGKLNYKGWQYSKNNIELSISPILSLLWDRQKDISALNLDWLEKYVLAKITKQAILSFAYKMFDTIFLACPVFLLWNILLQKML